MHLGLIGGIGPAATEFYYRGLVRAHAAVSRPMELTLVHAQVAELLQNLSEQASRRQAEVFLRLTERLQAAGAEVVAITSIGGHFCIREFEPLSPLPVLNALTALAVDLERRGIHRVGVLGTRAVMTSGFYGALPGIEVVAPPGPGLDQVHDTYVALGTTGVATEAQRAYLLDAGHRLYAEQGAQAIVLGGTDLFLAFDGAPTDYPVIDSAQVHIEALVRRSIGPGVL